MVSDFRLKLNILSIMIFGILLKHFILAGFFSGTTVGGGSLFLQVGIEVQFFHSASTDTQGKRLLITAGLMRVLASH